MKLFEGTPYDYSSTANGLVFVAGACPLDEQGTVVSPGDIPPTSSPSSDSS